jgi:hypothetical protein
MALKTSFIAQGFKEAVPQNSQVPLIYKKLLIRVGLNSLWGHVYGHRPWMAADFTS